MRVEQVNFKQKQSKIYTDSSSYQFYTNGENIVYLNTQTCAGAKLKHVHPCKKSQSK